MTMTATSVSLSQGPENERKPSEAKADLRLGGVLRALGVFGCAPIEDAILAGLALGEPVLLIGSPGCAKTRVAERLAAGLRMCFWAYDAGKALFEDVVGFPDPSSLAEGEVRYVPTRLSLWGKQFILVDEISRANPAMQNKWLEVVRSRRLMGMDLPDLKVIVAAMNPPGLPGTMALDDALAGRFTFHVTVPDAHQMDAADRRSVIEAADDAADASHLPDLRPLVTSIRTAMAAVDSENGGMVTQYVECLAEYFTGKDQSLDGRRLGMLRRAYLSLLAVHRALGVSPTDLSARLSLFRHGLDCTLPFAALGRDIGRVLVDGAHEFASATLRGQTRMLPPHDVLRASRELASKVPTPVDPDQASLLVTRIFQVLDHPRGIDGATRAGAALLTLACSRVAMERLLPDTRFRVLAGYRDLLDLEATDVLSYQCEARLIAFEEVLEPSLCEAALRIAFSLTSRLERGIRNSPEFDDVARLLVKEFRQGGEA